MGNDILGRNSSHWAQWISRDHLCNILQRSLAWIAEGMKQDRLYCWGHDFPCPHDAVHPPIFICYSHWPWDAVKHRNENKDSVSVGSTDTSETFWFLLFVDNLENREIVTYSSWWRQNCWPLPDCQCEASAWIQRCQTEPFLSETHCILDPRPVETGPLQSTARGYPLASLSIKMHISMQFCHSPINCPIMLIFRY